MNVAFSIGRSGKQWKRKVGLQWTDEKTRQRGKKKRIMKGKNGKDEMRRKKFKRESGVSGEKKGEKKTWSGKKKKRP